MGKGQQGVILKARIVLFILDRIMAFKKVIVSFLAYINNKVAKAKKGGSLLKSIQFEKDAMWDFKQKVGHIFLQEGADATWILSTQVFIDSL